MDYAVIYVAFMLGIVVGMIIIIRMEAKHQKDMKKIDDDFNEWKRMRSNQFIAEIDEMNSKSHEYWRDRAIEEYSERSRPTKTYNWR